MNGEKLKDLILRTLDGYWQYTQGQPEDMRPSTLEAIDECRDVVRGIWDHPPKFIKSDDICELCGNEWFATRIARRTYPWWHPKGWGKKSYTLMNGYTFEDPR